MAYTSTSMAVRTGASLAVVAALLGFAAPVAAQSGAQPTAQPPSPPDASGAAAASSGAPAISASATGASTPGSPGGGPEIIVTGFRASLNNALNQKRRETAAVDSIVAEDLGKFPDSNLAESMQRVPGVALARGDGGEGKNISVRGLGAAFTRVRIDGMEGTSQTGASDIYGAANAGRSFDFNVFPTEIFSELSVRKTPSADVEEGSLGATVDLQAPRPLAQRQDFVATATIRGVYGELTKRADPRGSLLVSKKFDDGRFGVLASLAYQRRHLREVGYSAVDILSANTNGGFCSPVGYTPINPALSALKGTTAANCSTGNPRTSSTDAYNTIVNARRADAPNTPGSGAFLPRIPRYLNSQQKQQRVGGTVTFQFQPDDHTDMSVDLLYSRFHVVRDDNYIEAISFGRSASNNGQPMTSVENIALNGNGSIMSGVFDGVDVRSEGLHDDFTSTFKQVNFNFKHDFNDRLTITSLVGLNDSKLRNPERLQYFMDAIDTDKFSFNTRQGGVPTLGFGFDVSNPNNFTYAPAGADGTVYGGFSLQGKPAVQDTKGLTGEVNGEWKTFDFLKFKAGGQYRRSDFLSTSTNYYTADTLVQALPAGTTLASLTTQITGLDNLWGHGAPASWATLDPTKLADTFNLFDSRACGVECGAGRNRVREEVMGGYLMGEFDLGDRLAGIGLRGDFGVRYVHTKQLSSAYIPVAAAGSPTGIAGQYKAMTRSYDDWLPSANIVIEPIHNLLVRLSGSKVMARPELASLIPTSTVNPVTRNGSIGNPTLEPIRATTFDASLEWYFRPGSLLSAGFFYKDIKTYVQSVSSLIPFTDLNLPVGLLTGSNTQPTELFSITQPTNTPGGPLKGVEVNAQLPLTFLPGFLKNFGILANYTHVISKINYVLASANGVPTVTTTADLVGLSKDTASATLYFENDRFSVRGTANYRGGFIRGIPASPGSNLLGNSSTIYVDASASLNLNDHIKVIVEGQNLTDEQNRLYVDSTRDDTLYQTRVGRTITFGVNVRL